ncbi:MAG: NAD(P)-dependent oxidoreductase [Deltaproteobacteria bacterium]|nr:NAD(P)-dependent oxidoreductase [Deltaproteobacteria bacterium]
MTYLVTGGTGFIGAHTVRLIEEKGEDVVVYDSVPDTVLLQRLSGRTINQTITVVKGDITDLDHLKKICDQYEIDKVIHTAAIIGSENPPLTVKVNCDGTMNILEVARLLGIERVVLTSSVAVFGNINQYKDGFVKNDAPHYPKSIYGACKSHNEACAEYYFRQYGLDTVAIRFPHVYGGGRKRGFGSVLDEELIIKPLTGKPGRVPNGGITHNWLYVKDAAKALVMASMSGKAETRAFTASGEIHPVPEVAEYIKSLVPGVKIDLMPGGTGIGLPYKYDPGPIKREIGFKPDWTVERALKDIIKYI